MVYYFLFYLIFEQNFDFQTFKAKNVKNKPMFQDDSTVQYQKYHS